MSISAVGFLFQNGSAGALHGRNYTCVIHKKTGNDTFKKSTVTSPDNTPEKTEYIDSEDLAQDLRKSIEKFGNNDGDKFVGAAIKDGQKETEVHSFLSDKLYAIRIKDENGKNHYRLCGKEKTGEVLKENLDLTA